jgi:hypothetical protein
MAKKMETESTGVVAAKHEGVAEIGEALDKAEQERVGEAGTHQGERHGGERVPVAGAQGLGGLLHRRADTFHHADQDEERDGGEREHLGEPDPRQAIDPA